MSDWLDRLRESALGLDGVWWAGAAALLLLIVAGLVWRSSRRRAAGRLSRPPGDAATAAPTGASATPVPAPRTLWARGLERSRRGLTSRLLEALRGAGDDDAVFDRIEEILLSSDVGVRCTTRLLAVLRGLPRAERTDEGIRRALTLEIGAILAPASGASGSRTATEGNPGRPHVVLVVGVNGVGKTTSIGKLAARYHRLGRTVLLVAGDTFRAAAIDQLGIWAERTGSQLVRSTPGSDPSAVTYDGMKAAVARGIDIVLVDSAGRLHTKANLMEELRKVRRVVEREIQGAPDEVLLVLDATTGQNAIAQARSFTAAVDVTGVVLTKLDGSARGGVVLAIREELGLPVQWVGLGEGVEDLEPFDAERFAESLVSAPAGPP